MYTPVNSITPLSALTLTCWIWPFFQWLVTWLFLTAGYDLNLGGGLLNLLACVLSIIAAIVFSVALYFAKRRPHSPANSKQVITRLAIFSVAASTLLMGFLASVDMFCHVGACPALN